MQKVVLAFHTKSSRQGEQENVRYVEHHETFKVKHRLSQGSIMTVDDEERLLLPIEDAPAHPVDVEDCGSIGCVTLYLAGTKLGSFPEASFFVDDSAHVIVEEDGSVRLGLRLSQQIVIEGKLGSSLLSNAALIEFIDIEQPNFMTFLKLPGGGRGFDGEEEYRKGIAFTPLTISMKVTPWLKKALALVDQMSSIGSSVDVELEPDDGLRRLVVEALGDCEHKDLFSDYVTLKNESNTLSELRILMLVIPVVELSSMKVSVFGMQLRLSNGWELTDATSLFDHDTNTWALWFMQFEAANRYWKFYVVVRFNWAELYDDEITDILEEYSSKMGNVLIGNNAAPENAFPPTFEANGTCLWLSTGWKWPDYGTMTMNNSIAYIEWKWMMLFAYRRINHVTTFYQILRPFLLACSKNESEILHLASIVVGGYPAK
eukprot:scaffold9037_cov150-Skeletonema_menzelii.AAC.6